MEIYQIKPTRLVWWHGNLNTDVSIQQIPLKPLQLSCKKLLKFALLGNYFSDLFSEVEIWY